MANYSIYPFQAWRGYGKFHYVRGLVANHNYLPLFQARRGYGEFHHVRSHFQTYSPAWNIEPETSHIFLFIGEPQFVFLPLGHLVFPAVEWDE